MKKRIIYSLSTIILIAGLATIIIYYGKGYRLNFAKKTITATGILAVSSSPEGASVWLNGKLTSATNTSISLPPNEYDVRISKEGYLSWEKKILIRKEIVSQAQALLVPANPSLRAITVTGIIAPVLSPSKNKVAFIIPAQLATESASLEPKTGVWLLDFRSRSLGGRNQPKKLYQLSQQQDLKNIRLAWSPDDKQIMMIFSEEKEATISKAILVSTENNDLPLLVTATANSLLKQWQDIKKSEQNLLIRQILAPLVDVLQDHAREIRFSPDETKIFYQATSAASLSLAVTPPLIGSNPTPEKRTLEAGKLYIYDTKEDKNFLLGEKSDNLTPEKIVWHSDSRHLILIEEDTISMVDYDGTNKRTVYAGPFDPTIFFPWPESNKLIILTTLNKNQKLLNLYEIDMQ